MKNLYLLLLLSSICMGSTTRVAGNSAFLQDTTSGKNNFKTISTVSSIIKANGDACLNNHHAGNTKPVLGIGCDQNISYVKSIL